MEALLEDMQVLNGNHHHHLNEERPEIIMDSKNGQIFHDTLFICNNCNINKES